MHTQKDASRLTNRNRMRGVTLMELMIVIVVIGILASIAVPSYRSYLLRAQRTDAMSALLRVAAAQEKFYLQNNTYAATALLDDAPPAGLGIGGTENGWYTLTISGADLTQAFTATATAVAGGAQAADTHCASFSLTSTGQKSATNADCWR